MSKETPNDILIGESPGGLSATRDTMADYLETVAALRRHGVSTINTKPHILRMLVDAGVVRAFDWTPDRHGMVAGELLVDAHGSPCTSSSAPKAQ